MLDYIAVLIWPLVFITIAVLINVFAYRKNKFQLNLFQFRGEFKELKDNAKKTEENSLMLLQALKDENEYIKAKISSLEVRDAFKNND